MSNQLSQSLPEQTFQYQNSLPPLPVPSLHSSLSKYLDAGRMPAVAELVRFQAVILYTRLIIYQRIPSV